MSAVHAPLVITSTAVDAGRLIADIEGCRRPQRRFDVLIAMLLNPKAVPSLTSSGWINIEGRIQPVPHFSSNAVDILSLVEGRWKWVAGSERERGYFAVVFSNREAVPPQRSVAATFPLALCASFLKMRAQGGR